jgi:putative MATE family efflux protein
LLAIMLGFASGYAGAFVAPAAMALMGAEGAVKDYGATYMRLVLLAAPFYAVAIAGGGVLRGTGDTRTPMRFTLVSNSLKILLSAILIFGRFGFPALGVKGAGLATLFGYGLNSLLITSKLARGFGGMRLRWRHFKPDTVLLRRILVLALPVAGEQIIMRLGFVFYMRVVSALGTVALAANQIALRLESISLTIGFGFTIAATTLVGQAVGRRDVVAAIKRAGATARLSVLTMGSMTVILLLLRRWAVGMFMPDADVRHLAIACLIIGAFELPALGFLFTFAGALRGAGDTRSPMVVSLAGTFVLRLPLVYLLGIHLNMGLRGIWYGTLLDWIGRAILIHAIFRSGSWKRRAFISEGEMAENQSDDLGN